MEPATAAIGGALLTGGASLLGSIASGLFAQNINERNIQMQQETNSQNEALMREAWARDDTARQRMVADFEAAGLSKWLATGASPMASSPVSLQSPRADKVPNLDFGAAMDRAFAAYSNMIQVEETKAQTELLEQQRLAAVADTRSREAKARVDEHDADILTKRSGASTDPAYIKYLDEGVNTLTGESDRGKKLIDAAKVVNDMRNGTLNPADAAALVVDILQSDTGQSVVEKLKEVKAAALEVGKKAGGKLQSAWGSFANFCSNVLETFEAGLENKYSYNY